jgi:hypothetical protein
MKPAQEAEEDVGIYVDGIIDIVSDITNILFVSMTDGQT